MKLKKKTHHRGRVRKEFWGKRPLAYHMSNKTNKVICHRIERHRAKQDLDDQIKELDDEDRT